MPPFMVAIGEYLDPRIRRVVFPTTVWAQRIFCTSKWWISLAVFFVGLAMYPLYGAFRGFSGIALMGMTAAGVGAVNWPIGMNQVHKAAQADLADDAGQRPAFVALLDISARVRAATLLFEVCTVTGLTLPIYFSGHAGSSAWHIGLIVVGIVLVDLSVFVAIAPGLPPGERTLVLTPATAPSEA